MSVPPDTPCTSALERALRGVESCTRCSLCGTRTHVVTGCGDPDARVMLVGEAPGAAEDATGEPFVGAAGKRLDALLAVAGLSRGDVYIANILKCRPPGNRDPKKSEVAACTPWLDAQIDAVDPEVVVSLGNFATRFVLGTTEGITDVRGRVREVDGRTVLPVFHPAAAMYDPSKRAALEADFELLGRL